LIITEPKYPHFFVCKRTGFFHEDLRDFCKNDSESNLESLTVTRVESFCENCESSRVTIFFNVTRVESESPKIVTQVESIESSDSLEYCYHCLVCQL